jgi:hypothetical protein
MELFDVAKKQTVRQLFIEPLTLLPEFLLHPARFISERFQDRAPLAQSISSALIFFVLGVAASVAIGIEKQADLSSALFLSIGTITLWMGYAIFLHVFAVGFGARRGFNFTIAAYLYLMGFLQPVFVVTLWLLTLFVPESVTHRTIGAFGPSGFAHFVAAGRFFSEDLANIYRAVSSVLILTYFAITLSAAHKLRLWRGIAAAVLSFVFFYVVFEIAYLYSTVFGNGVINRLYGG